MLHGPVTKQVCLALRKVTFGVVTERVIGANPLFFICFKINDIRFLGQPRSSNFTTSFSNKIPGVLHFLFFFSKQPLQL